MLSFVAAVALAGSPVIIPPRISAGHLDPGVGVTGLPPGERAHLVTGATIDAGPCVGPLCLGVSPPIRLLGSDLVGAEGNVWFGLGTIPADFARVHVPLQAVLVDGTASEPVEARIGPRTLVVAQDVTGSFRDDIDAAREANLHIVNGFALDPWPGDQLGMTTFVGGVDAEPWSPLQLVGDGAALVDRWSTLETCNCALGDHLTEELCLEAYDGWVLFDPYDTCWEWFCETYYGNSDDQPWMTDCFDVGSQTSPGPGIDQAVDEILASPHPIGPDPAVLLLSDGLPCCGELIAERQAMAIAAADRADDAGIDLYVIGFNEGGADFGFLADLVRGDGVMWEVTEADDIPESAQELVRILSQ